MQVIERKPYQLEKKNSKVNILAHNILQDLKEDSPILIKGQIASKKCKYSEYYKSHIILITLVKNVNIKFIGILEEKALKQLEKNLNLGDKVYVSAFKSQYRSFNIYYNGNASIRKMIPVTIEQFYDLDLNSHKY